MDSGLSHDKDKSKAVAGGSVDSLDCDSCEVLDVKDYIEHTTSDEDFASHVEGFEDLNLSDTKPREKSFFKYPTFPPSKISSSATFVVNEQDEDDELKTALQQTFSDDVHSPCSCATSLPTPLKLISAMKGSREKQGASPRKLNVKWAPDVYDPPPTIMSHTANRGKKQQKSREDKNYKQKKGKKGRKGNSSNSGSKDKKQYHKMGRASLDKYYKLMDARSGVILLPDGRDDFVVAGSDFCGSIFLRESLSKVHYSVAEAL